MTRLSNLAHLQSLDLERAENLERTRAIDRVLARNPKVEAAHTAHQTEQKRLGEIRAQYQNLELESQSVGSRIQEIEKRLYSGTIANPKELESYEMDRQMHQRHKDELETRMLELLDRLDSAQKRAEDAEQVLKEADAMRSSQVAKLETERATLAARLSELDQLRDTTRRGIESETLMTYDRLYGTKSGRAMAQVKQNACAGCGMQIPSALIARIDSNDELIFCPSCGRILTD